MDFNPTAEEVITELSNNPDGKVQLELAVLRAVVARQRKHIEENMTGDDDDDTSE